MYDDKITKQLKDTYGIDTPGNCSRCKLRKNRSISRSGSSLDCGELACPMLTEYELLKVRADCDSGIVSEETASISRMLLKLQMIGYSYKISPPWIIWSGSGDGKYWMNIKHKAFRNVQYKVILHKGDMLICCKNMGDGHIYSDVEVYSIQCKNTNITEGIHIVSYRTGNFERWANMDGYADFIATDENGNKACLVVSKYGDRLMVPYDDNLTKLNRNGLMHIELGNNKGVVVTDNRLNVLRQHNVPFAFRI